VVDLWIALTQSGYRITRFIQSILKEESIVVDVVTDEVNVFASGQEYKNVKVDLRKSFSMQGTHLC
jgi:hypothetical protein